MQTHKIRGVVFRQADPKITNKRSERTLYGVYNGDQDLAGYKAAQVKLYELHQDDYLGKSGHYHLYAELYCVIHGEATFDLWDRDTNAQERFVLTEGQLILVPAGIAHRAYAKKNTLMFGSSSRPYTFNPAGDIPAHFDPIGSTPYNLN
jgi:mannose-6-phosphate isomerase-like protein (cupin superfamily)